MITITINKNILIAGVVSIVLLLSSAWLVFSIWKEGQRRCLLFHEVTGIPVEYDGTCTVTISAERYIIKVKSDVH